MTTKTHWVNPWSNAIPVPIEELAECHAGLGRMCARYLGVDQFGSEVKETFTLTREKVLEHWGTAGDKLDAYILPQPSGYHCIGIRYGSEDQDYLSPAGDKEKVQDLLKRYT